MGLMGTRCHCLLIYGTIDCIAYNAVTLIMAEGFGENVAPTAAIRAILGSYPFSIGLLREILQNSDDAKASKQVSYLFLSPS